MSTRRARLADSLADDLQSIAPREAEEWRTKAGEYRDLPWLVLPGDQVWITIEPRNHPELKSGVACIIVVRQGEVMYRERLGVY